MISIIRANKLPTAALLYIILLIITRLAAPWISPYDPFHTNHQQKLLPPSIAHPFGTDYLGRDLLSRVIHGISESVFPVFIVLSVVMLIGLLVGTWSAFLGNKLDMLMMSLTDIFTALPSMLLTIVVVGFLGFGMENVYFAVILSWWAKYVRIIRGLIHDVKKEPYITASRVSGAFGIRIITKHMIPNITPQIGTMLILDVSKVILTLSGLSFLGIGAQPPSPEWGVMLLDGKNYLQVAPWMGFFPGFMIFLTAASFQIIGERLRRER